MNQILHILKKDLHRYAWAWITLFALAGIEVYLHGTTAGLLESKLNSMLTLITSMVGGILFFVVTIMMVQEESLADPDAYWLGRPIARGKLLIGKLLFVVMLISIYTLSDAIVLSLNGGAHRIPYALLGILSSLAIWQGQIFLAAQTRSLPRYLLLTVCLVVAFYAFAFSLMLSAFSGFDFDLNPALLPSDISSHTLALIQTLYWLTVGLGLLAFLYLKRRILISWLLLIPAIFIASCLTPKDSFYGIDTEFSFPSGESKIDLIHLRESGTMHTNGNKYIGYEAIFEIDSVENDVWATVSEVIIRNEDQEFELEATGMSQKLKIEPNGNRSLRLGYLKKTDNLDKEASFDVSCSLQLSFSKQVEVDRLNLNEGATHIDNGNRLVVRSLYRSDDQLNVDLAGIVPQYSLEPSPLGGDYEAFSGQYSFALADRRNKIINDFNLSQSWGDFGTIQTGTIKVHLSEDAESTDYEIIIFSRKLSGQTWEFINAKSIPIN